MRRQEEGRNEKIIRAGTYDTHLECGFERLREEEEKREEKETLAVDREEEDATCIVEGVAGQDVHSEEQDVMGEVDKRESPGLRKWQGPRREHIM